MAIGICIDVDLTLIDKEGKLLPGARDALAKSHDAGFSLTLWSLAGVEYAKSVAAKHQVESFFDGFAGKPDVVIDDDMESLRPRLRIDMRPNRTWAEVAESILKEVAAWDGKPEDPIKILSLVEETQTNLARLRENQHDLFPTNELPLHPIPFFGNPFGAEILTMALNPSWKEFAPPRQWPTPLETNYLASRLLRCFELPEQEPVSWFEPFDKAVLYLERSYLRDAAHVDPLPYPTLRPRDIVHLPEARQALGRLLLDTAPAHFERLLGLCQNVKLVLIRDYPLNLIEGVNSTFDFITNFCPVVGRHAQASGAMPPILRLPAGNNSSDVVYRKRPEIIRYLGNAQSLDFG